MAMSSFALLLFSLFLCAKADLIHVPLSRRAVSGSRLFSFASRPWAQRLPTPSDPLTRAHLFRSQPPVNQTIPVVPLYGDLVKVGEYYVELQFGGQSIHVQLDTGSSTMAVPLEQCTNCRPDDRRFDLEKAKGTAGLIGCSSDACGANTCNLMAKCQHCSRRTRACCSTVASDACGFFLQYADGAGVSGALAQADVTIAGLTVPLVFGTILRETSDFENLNVDGIFGMAYKSLACNPTCVTPLFDTLLEQGKIKQDVFSLCTGPHGGTLILGGSSSHFYKGKLQYVPLIERSVPHFYDIAVQGVTVGGAKVNVPAFSDAIVDSGTTLLVLAPNSYAALKAYFQKEYCHVPGLCAGTATREGIEMASGAELIHAPAEFLGPQTVRKDENTWFSPGYCVRLTERELEMLPDIVIKLDNNVELVLESKTYMLEYEQMSALGLETIKYRCLGIGYLDGLQLMENNAIIGNTVLQKYFVEHDRKNSRLGFAVAANCMDSPHRSATLDMQTSHEKEGLPRWLTNALIGAGIIAGIVIIAICVIEARKRTGYHTIPASS